MNIPKFTKELYKETDYWKYNIFYNMDTHNSVALEIGAYIGERTSFLSEKFKTVLVIDPWDGRQQGNSSIMERFLKNTEHCDNIKICKFGSETEQARKFLEEEANNLKFVYIDGLHTYDAVVNDINLCLDFCDNGGVFLVDDVISVGGITQACDEFEKHPNIELIGEFNRIEERAAGDNYFQRAFKINE